MSNLSFTLAVNPSGSFLSSEPIIGSKTVCYLRLFVSVSVLGSLSGVVEDFFQSRWLHNGKETMRVVRILEVRQEAQTMRPYMDYMYDDHIELRASIPPLNACLLGKVEIYWSIRTGVFPAPWNEQAMYAR